MENCIKQIEEKIKGNKFFISIPNNEYYNGINMDDVIGIVESYRFRDNRLFIIPKPIKPIYKNLLEVIPKWPSIPEGLKHSLLGIYNIRYKDEKIDYLEIIGVGLYNGNRY